MAETKWTRGPWRMNEWRHVVGPDGKEIRCTGLSLAGGNVGMEEPQANDLLIAAAPDLYAVLEEAVRDYGSRMPAGWFNDAVRALMRARGEG